MKLSVLTRRKLLAGSFCLCCLPATARRAFAAVAPFATEEVAEGVHIRRGVDQDATAANEDAIANIGFIIGRDGVLVVDPGGSLIDGQSLRATIREKTKLPIKYVVMSHIHPDHIFGAAAFLEDQPVFVGHHALGEAMRQRGDYYRGVLADIVGEDRSGTIVQPTLEVQDAAEFDLGDRIIAAHAHGVAHTTSDLSLIDRKTGLLLTADLVFVQRMPSLDGSLPGWLKELQGLKQIGAPRAVPGHGPVAIAWPAGAADIERYLTTLQRGVEKAIEAGVEIEKASASVAQDERGRWTLFDDYNGRNVIAAYKELEWR
ncbi:beta-lactamase domain protein [Methylocella silvestris BL2]|uniref:Beta-lactamase domain protein n=1 Tax=Methylocella silvestris (strain DSM 15510 / CIP 108128 / LMG 27833 / NCIMB 13906 / BL2) TaxID=395965 RepID=B8ENY6_METSB|nr:quinoprotein relay system zinc metallohydrolase 2 [Methylocella silvestris]ACK49224.1 beta-lactamase domain protein [Methylocella silvestris BL2]